MTDEFEKDEIILMDLLNAIDMLMDDDAETNGKGKISDKKFCKQVFVACFLSAGYSKVYDLIPGCLINKVKDEPSEELIKELLKKDSLIEEYKKAVEIISISKAMSILT